MWWRTKQALTLNVTNCICLLIFRVVIAINIAVAIAITVDIAAAIAIAVAIAVTIANHRDRHCHLNHAVGGSGWFTMPPYWSPSSVGALGHTANVGCQPSSCNLHVGATFSVSLQCGRYGGPASLGRNGGLFGPPLRLESVLRCKGLSQRREAGTVCP